WPRGERRAARLASGESTASRRNLRGGMAMQRTLTALSLALFLCAATAEAQIWSTTLNGTNDGYDSAEATAVLPSGDVVVVGNLDNGNWDALAARLSAVDGTPVWR